MRDARGDAARARKTYPILPSATHSSCCVYAGASLQRPTADSEEMHRSGTLSRSGTTRWPTPEEKRPKRLTMPRDARPARLSSFCLLALASLQLDARRNLLISQHTSRIMRGADSRSMDSYKNQQLADLLKNEASSCREADLCKSRLFRGVALTRHMN